MQLKLDCNMTIIFTKERLFPPRTPTKWIITEKMNTNQGTALTSLLAGDNAFFYLKQHRSLFNIMSRFMVRLVRFLTWYVPQLRFPLNMDSTLTHFILFRSKNVPSEASPLFSITSFCSLQPAPTATPPHGPCSKDNLPRESD